MFPTSSSPKHRRPSHAFRSAPQAFARSNPSANLTFTSQFGDGLTKGSAYTMWKHSLQTSTAYANQQVWGGDVRAATQARSSAVFLLRPVRCGAVLHPQRPDYSARGEPHTGLSIGEFLQDSRPTSAARAERFFAWIKQQQLYYSDITAKVRAAAVIASSAVFKE